ncbi:hypothetical protein [Modicisalibacter coralii]|uniref:hypothetical protein n=1 Tax=Modicisalibacter coralii TaxID=2304602 RepID=UPI00100B14C7|nr:hypothetical protein [Halomonas coralii]
MEDIIGYTVAGLLVLSAALLGTLIPGGPIENRNFSHIPPVKLAMFNVFLTVLGIGSFALVYFAIIGAGPAFVVAALFGLAYFFVYALDLGKIFPVSPDGMPRALFWIEVVGLILSIPLMVLSLASIFMANGGVHAPAAMSSSLVILIALTIVLGIGIVIFATRAAMRKSPGKADSAAEQKRQG